jgi:hypothetical protein
MFKVVDPDQEDDEVHELHMFPSSENTDKHDFNQDCWCEPAVRAMGDYKDVAIAVGEGDQFVDHVVVEHSRSDH